MKHQYACACMCTCLFVCVCVCVCADGGHAGACVLCVHAGMQACVFLFIYSQHAPLQSNITCSSLYLTIL